MKTRNFLIILSFIPTFCFGQEIKNDLTRKSERTEIDKNHDTICNLTVETVTITKQRIQLFIKMNLEKLIIKDLIKTHNKVILKGKSKFVTSTDAAKTIRFARIRIRDNKIFKYKKSSLRKRGTIIEYDLTGKQLKKERIDKENVIFEYTRE